MTSVLPHLSEFEALPRLKRTAGKAHRRWLMIWNALVDPRPASEIALHKGVSVSSEHDLISRYERIGPKAIGGYELGKKYCAHLGSSYECVPVRCRAQILLLVASRGPVESG